MGVHGSARVGGRAAGCGALNTYQTTSTAARGDNYALLIKLQQ